MLFSIVWLFMIVVPVCRAVLLCLEPAGPWSPDTEPPVRRPGPAGLALWGPAEADLDIRDPVPEWLRGFSAAGDLLSRMKLRRGEPCRASMVLEVRLERSFPGPAILGEVF